MQICENIARHVADIETKLILRILVGALALWRSGGCWAGEKPDIVLEYLPPNVLPGGFVMEFVLDGGVNSVAERSVEVGEAVRRHEQ